jgi:hypothetical protein
VVPTWPSFHGLSCSRRLSPFSGRFSTYRPVQISGTSSGLRGKRQADSPERGPCVLRSAQVVRRSLPIRGSSKMAAIGFLPPGPIYAPRRKSEYYFNNIRVRSSVLNGATFRKTRGRRSGLGGCGRGSLANPRCPQRGGERPPMCQHCSMGTAKRAISVTISSRFLLSASSMSRASLRTHSSSLKTRTPCGAVADVWVYGIKEFPQIDSRGPS